MDFSAIKTLIEQNIRTNNNEDITGSVLQNVLLGIIETLGDDAINDLITALGQEVNNRQNAVQGEADARSQADNTILGKIANILNGGYLYQGIAGVATNPGNPTVSCFYFAKGAGTYTNFRNGDNDPIVITDNGLYALTYEAVENEYWEYNKITDLDDGVFDISRYHASGGTLATYADLSAAIGTNGANVPAAFRKGGMSIKFVHTSDNKYVQCIYKSSSTAAADFTALENWELDVTNKTLSNDFLGILSEISDFAIQNYAIVSSGKFGDNGSSKHAVLPVNEGEIYYLIGQNSNVRAAYATSDESSPGGNVPYVNGTWMMSMPATGQYYKFVIPPGCSYLLFNVSGSYGTRCFKHYNSLKKGTDEYTDNNPTEGSEKLVKSGGVWQSVQSVNERINEFYAGTEKAWASGGVIDENGEVRNVSGWSYIIADLSNITAINITATFDGDSAYAFLDDENGNHILSWNNTTFNNEMIVLSNYPAAKTFKCSARNSYDKSMVTFSEKYISIEEEKEDIDKINKKLYNLRNIDWTHGGYIDSNGEIVGNSNWNYVVIDISGIDTLILTTRLRASNYCFLDDENGNHLLSFNEITLDNEVIELSDYPTAKIFKASGRDGENYLLQRESDSYAKREELENVKIDVEINRNGIDKINNAIYLEPESLEIPSIMNSYCIKNTGEMVQNGNSGCTNFIKVNPLDIVYLNGVYLEGTRSVYGYDKNQSPKALIASGSDDTELTFIVPEDVFYIRATIVKFGTITGTIKTKRYVDYKQDSADSGKVLSIKDNGDTFFVGLPPRLQDLLRRSACKAFLTRPLTFSTALDDITVYANGLFYGVTAKPSDYKNPITTAVYVDNVNGDDTNTGTEESPLKTIDGAITAGADTIYLKRGKYESLANGIRQDINIIGIDDDVKIVEALFVGNYRTYVENITFVGGRQACFIFVEVATDKPMFCALNCKFTGSTVSDGLLVLAEATVRLFSCIAYNNCKDGFSYNKNTSTTPKSQAPNILEIDCESYNNGNANSTTDNGSTAHGGAETIRVNGYYHDNHGGNVADVDHTKTWNVGCRAGHSLKTVGDVNNTDFQIREYAEMYCDNCYASDSEFDGLVEDNSNLHIAGGYIKNIYLDGTSTKVGYTSEAEYQYYSAGL